MSDVNPEADTLSPLSASMRIDRLVVGLEHVVYEQSSCITRHSHRFGQLLRPLSGALKICMSSGAWIVPASYALWVPPDWSHEVFISPGTELSTVCYPEGAPRCAETLVWAEMWPGCTDVFDVPFVVQVPEDRISASKEKSEMLQEPILLPTDRRARRVALSVLSGHHVEFTLEQWGGFAGASARTIARAFEREVGEGFRRWRMRVQMIDAISLLSHGVTVKSTSYALGYGHPSAFIKAFFDFTGRTPSRYLREASPQGADDTQGQTRKSPMSMSF